MDSEDRNGDGSAGRSAAASVALVYCYRFGTAAFDEARSELRVGGNVVELEQKPLQVLAQLLHHPGEVVTREELFDAVWEGRPTVDNVLANAVAKLRKALGPGNAALITTLPRAGYRLEGSVERTAAGRRMTSQLDLRAGMPVPGRPHFILKTQLGTSPSSEVWLAVHAKTGKPRVYKFSADGERLAALKREATIYRLLRDTLGERSDLVAIVDWNFDAAPFFLECEYGGVNLLEWAAGESGLASLSMQEKLSLFLQMADAVATAHDVGVLHKDLKPANVLIAPAAAPAPPNVRIADFGSGRLLEPERLGDLGITSLGFTVAAPTDTSGTVLYLAPELLAGHPPTVQSDLYALGLILYQLTAGDLRRPLVPGWEQDVPDELLREDIAASTDGDPKRRLRSVGELCNLLRRREARLTEREALRAAEARARDAERAVERNKARRPWVLVAGALLVTGLAVGLWQFHRVQLARDDARVQAAIATAVNRFMTDDLIGAADPSVSGRKDVTVIEAVRNAIPLIDSRLGDSPAIRAALHLALEKTLAELNDSKSSVGEGRKAIALLESLKPANPEGLAEARIWLAYDLSRTGEYAEAGKLLDQAEQAMPDLADPDHDLQLRLWHVRSVLLSYQQNLREAEAYDEKAWALLETLPEGSRALESMRDQVQFDIAEYQSRVGHLAEAEAALRNLIARQGKRLGAGHHQTLFSGVLLANVLVLQKRFAEAKALLGGAIDGLTKALGATSHGVLLAKGVLANIDLLTGDYPVAAALYGEVRAALVDQFGERNQNAIVLLESQATALQWGGDARTAEPLFRKALAAARESFKEDNPLVQHLRYTLAHCLLELHSRPAEAASLLEHLDPKILTLAEQVDWDAGLAYLNGMALLQLGNAERALALLQKAEGLLAGQDAEDGNVPLKDVRAQRAAAQRALKSRAVQETAARL